MQENNPYSAPVADLEDESSEEYSVHAPNTVPAGQGWDWIVTGFALFKQAPGPWIGIIILGFVLLVLLNILPVVGFFTGCSTYIWIGGIMLGCKALDQGEPLQISHLFAGFTHSLWPLLGLGVIIGLMSAAIVGIALGSLFLPAMLGDLSQFPDDLDINRFLISILIALMLLIPVMMAAWFAPLLIIINNVPLLNAMAMSFKACLVNIVPFLLYGIVLLVLTIVAAIPLGLGYFILVPVVYASIFTSYKDIFID